MKDMNLRSKDVAHILDCSPDDVISLAHRGRLKGYKVGRFWRFKLADVAAYKKRLKKLEVEQARHLKSERTRAEALGCLPTV